MSSGNAAVHTVSFFGGSYNSCGVGEGEEGMRNVLLINGVKVTVTTLTIHCVLNFTDDSSAALEQPLSQMSSSPAKPIVTL